MQHRGKLVLTVLTVMAAFAALLVGAAGRSNAVVPPGFISPDHVNSTFEGCNNDGTVTLPNGSGKFVCPDSDYTSGNLGKGWNELDLVPFRLVLSSGNQSNTPNYNLIVGGDSKLSNVTGWDVIGDPSINPSITIGNKTTTSDSSCQVSANAQDTGPGITGGATSSLYRVLSIHQNPGTTCIIDYYMRIALGAHAYPGSSLQAYIFSTSDFSTGKSTIPLPVNQILPQSTSKDMTATQDSNTPWDVSKSATPATVHFGDYCSNTFTNTQNVDVKVTWTKLAPVGSGDVLLVTHVYATNPASRAITTTVSDQMYQGTDQSTSLGSPDSSGPVDVPANTANFLILTDTQTVPAVAGVTHYNDVATATYTDAVTGVPVPGNTTASAGADITAGNTTNANATVTDAESITGTNLHFKVASPSSGSFTNGYTAGNYVDGTTTPSEVDWSSGSNAISSSGSITFNKTIKLDPPSVTSGTLSDTATLNGSDGFGPITAGLDVGIDSSATSTLTINKDISQSVSSAQTFHFDVLNASNSVVASNVPVTVAAGHTSGSAQVTDLGLGSYTVHEDAPPTGWTADDDQTTDLTGCTGSVTFNDTFAPATAFANKVTDPTGYQQGWTFTLTRPGSSTLTGTTDSNGHVVWDDGGSSTQTSLGTEGTYTISETAQTGWTETGAAQAAGSTGTVTGGTGVGASCSFTVTYPGDADKSFGCTITNKSRAHVKVTKTFEGSDLTGSESFDFQLRQGADATHDGTTLEPQTLAVGNDPVTFATDLIPGETYQMCEVLQTDINSSLSDDPDSFNPNGDTGVVCVNFTPDPGELVPISVDNTPVPATARVEKVTIPAGSEAGWDMTLNGPGAGPNGETVTTTGADFIPFTTQLQDGGHYTITETAKDGWDQTGTSGDCSFDVNYPADANKTFSCTITNTERGSITIKKVTDPVGGTGFSFTGDVSGTLDDGQTATTSDLVPGTYTSAETAKTGWTLQSISCDDPLSANPSSGDVATSTATFNLDPGENVTCTFTNKSRAHVKVTKTFEGSDLTGSESFDFQLRQGADATHDGTTLEPQTLAVGNDPVTFATDLIPGETYQMCEVLQTDINSSLSDEVGSFNPNGDTGVVCVNFTPDPGELVAFLVDNTPVPATAQVKKVTIPAGSEAGWDMTLNGPGAGPNGETVTTTGTGFIPFTTQLQDGGHYTITETAKTGWDQTGTSGDCTFDVNYPADANKTFSCTITNTERGSITIKKVTDPAGGTGFSFTGDVSGTLDDQGTATTSDLVPGTYHSVEGSTAGWTLQSISCDDPSSAHASSGSVATSTATFNLDPGEHVTCTFTNKSRGHVRVIKTLNGGPLGSQSFTFQLRTGASKTQNGTVIDQLVASSGNNGTITFSGPNDALVPGQTYQICELLVAGYGPSFPNGFGPYNPNDDTNYLCMDFSISVSDVATNGSTVTVTFNVDNNHSFAKGLTIGYWKNHAAANCKKSNGKQTDVLGQYLDGIMLGNVTFHDPAQSGSATECNAVQTLSKNTFGGTKKSSDPLFNMAAQLLAAELNVATGDVPSATAGMAISQAQALLTKYHWNGNTYSPALTPADAALANTLNTILDEFNNNQI